MANHNATKKDTRQANKRRERNRYHGKTTRNAMRDLLAEAEKGVKGDLSKVVGMLDKLAKKNIIHKNKAANLKSSLTKTVNAVGTAKAEVKPVRKAAAKKVVKKK